MFEHNISRVIFTIGPITIRYYSLMFICAFLVGAYILKKVLKLKKIDEELLYPMCLMVFLGVFVGARLGHVLFYDLKYFLSHPGEIIMVWKGGLASHGAAIGLIIGTIIFARKHNLTFYQVADCLVIPISLGTSFVRLGNFFNSEIVGRVTTVPWAVKFLRLQEPGGMEPQFRHPSQLYEVMIGIIIFVTLWVILKKKGDKLQNGFIFYLMLFLYFSLRFLVEFVKEFPFIIPSLPFTTGHYLSIPFILFSGHMLFFKLKKIKK